MELERRLEAHAEASLARCKESQTVLLEAELSLAHSMRRRLPPAVEDDA